MCEFDILFVTFNSEKWIDHCLKSIAASDYDLKKIGVYFVDNNSSDATVQTLESKKLEYGHLFKEFKIDQQKENLGFGKGNNRAAQLGTAPYLFCLNIDTQVFPDTLKNLSETIEKDDPAVWGLWELRQFPYEHPKLYDPLTGETSWSSGAAFAIRREVFERIGGFDSNIFMYGEDVDLSWRVRAEGLKLHYVPKATVLHFCYQKAGEVKPTQYIYSLLANLYLRFKFGSFKDRVASVLWFFIGMLKKPPFSGARKLLFQEIAKSIPLFQKAKKWQQAHRSMLEKHDFHFYGFIYELKRIGDFHPCERPLQEKKVSVIVRTCGRPSVLRETLISLRNQTYPNIEIVIVEDGPDISRKMIEEEFADLNIVYSATNEKHGRCYNGNLAMKMATGDYLNFLDDDDLFYADHVETLVMALQRQPEYKAAYTVSFETAIQVHSREPYVYDIKSLETVYNIPFDLQELLQHNLFPIQTIMFEKSIFDECGGLDEKLDVLEDWDLWIRYALKHPFLYVPKTTSIYRVPAIKEERANRQLELDNALKTVKNRYQKHVVSLNAPSEHSAEPSHSQSSMQKLKKYFAHFKGEKGINGLLFKLVKKLYLFSKQISKRLYRMIGRV